MREFDALTIAPRCLHMVDLQEDIAPTHRPQRQRRRERRQPGATAWMAAGAVFITALCALDTPGPAGIAAGVAAVGAAVVLGILAVLTAYR